MIVDLHVCIPSSMTDEVIDRVISDCCSAGLDGACFCGIDAAPQMESISASAVRAGFQAFFGVELSLARGRLVWIPQNPDELRGELPVGRSLEEIIAFFKERGGVMFAAHPYDRSDGAPFADSCWELDDITGIEVVNAGRDPWKNNMAQDVASQLKIRGFGGTGRREPGPGEIGSAATLLLDEVASQAELVRELVKDDVWALEFLSDQSQFGEDQEPKESRTGSVNAPRTGGHHADRPGHQNSRGGRHPEGHGGSGGGRPGHERGRGPGRGNRR